MNQRSPRALSTSASIWATALLLLALPAHAQQEVTLSTQTRPPARPGEFSLKLEPGVAVSLGRPQSQIFEVGGSQTVKALWSLKPYLDLGPSVTFLGLPAEGSSLREAGTAWTFGAGVQLKRPHNAPNGDKFYAISPWVDMDLLYVRTGELNRPGFAAAVGLAVPIGAARVFWLGPFVRYLQILQGARSGFDNRDANLLSVGVSLEVGSGSRRETPVIAAAEVRTVDRETIVCPDRDKDTVPDSVDRCPDALGTTDNYGCPAYEKLVVKKDKLELKERLYFSWDQGTLQEASYPVLNEVVQALKDNKGFKVQVEGHTSSEGTSDHNQTLSEKRAAAVLDYLVAHGIEKERLVSKGFSSSAPTDTNETAAGRENNRRVEFVVNFMILDEGNK